MWNICKDRAYLGRFSSAQWWFKPSHAQLSVQTLTTVYLKIVAWAEKLPTLNNFLLLVFATGYKSHHA
jgi:hypothetical protein